MKLSLVVSALQTRFGAVAFSGDVLAHIAQVARLGYAGIELSVRDPALIDVDAIEAALQRSGLSVPAIGTGQAWGEERLSFTDASAQVRADALRRFESQIHLAARLQAVPVLGLMRGVTSPGVSQSQAMAWLADALKACAQTAGPLGVRILIEPINRYETDLVNTIDDGLALVERAGADNIGLMPDTFHMNIEEASIEASLRRAGRLVQHFHVADSNRWYPGAGHLDFPRLLGVLRHDLGYTDWVSGEFLPLPDGATAAERGLAHLRQALKADRNAEGEA